MSVELKTGALDWLAYTCCANSAMASAIARGCSGAMARPALAIVLCSTRSPSTANLDKDDVKKPHPTFPPAPSQAPNSAAQRLTERSQKAF
ncbi:MAG: hypothetical protein WC818_28325 [Pseudomonas sp.]|jgi:hypothetical protein|uniref:hypothetical protein n=1 Tax=Pseudomonas sp. TaxID=306 RepID=UPI0035620AC5